MGPEAVAFLQVVGGFVAGAAACFLVIKNQMKNSEDWKAKIAQIEAKARTAADELWDDLSETKAKLAELAGKFNAK